MVISSSPPIHKAIESYRNRNVPQFGGADHNCRVSYCADSSVSGRDAPAG